VNLVVAVTTGLLVILNNFIGILAERSAFIGIFYRSIAFGSAPGAVLQDVIHPHPALPNPIRLRSKSLRISNFCISISST
jgi:hypothetical protein